MNCIAPWAGRAELSQSPYALGSPHAFSYIKSFRGFVWLCGLSMSHAKGDIKAANFPDSTFFMWMTLIR
jgi:hypothetical protein